jgi:hypothetical protein
VGTQGLLSDWEGEQRVRVADYELGGKGETQKTKDKRAHLHRS